jgi:mono/diheme cytochrome c family protein
MNISSRIYFLIFFVLAAILVVTPSYALSKKESEQAGATLFRDKGCAYCHGLKAQGTAKGPSLADDRTTMKPPQIADQIQNGGQKMPSFKDSLSDDEVMQLVLFLRAKHRPAPAPVQTPAPVSNPAR